MQKKRTVAAILGDGRIGLMTLPRPAVRAGTVGVDVCASLISPGTELGGWRALLAQRDHPQRGADPKPFGYSNAGVVVEVGAGVTAFKPGDRVACIGGGCAQHTDYAVVPHHLCTALPAGVTMAQGAYAMLAATGLHAMRRLDPEFGECTVVAGMGLVGQLTARLLQLAGHFVIGWDSVPLRLEIARRWGIDGTATVGVDDVVARTREFTKGTGLDAAVVAFAGDANATIKSIEDSMKVTLDGHPMGRVVVVGNPQFLYTSSLTNMDIRRASRTGPGYHDETWETGPDYPPVFMPWTTRTNLALCMRLIALGRLNVDALTTHTIPLADVEARVSAIVEQPDDILGVVIQMRKEEA